MNEVDLEQVAGQVTGTNPSTPKERPWLFGLLIAPMAVLSNGLISGALSYLLRRQGVGIGRSSEIIALLILPQSIYFLWSPITDFWIRRRTWLIVGAVGAALTLVAAFHGGRLDTPSAVALMFLSACFGQLIVSSCGGMMGTLHSELNRRRASSFYQAGSLAFGALGIFALASLAEKFSVGPLGWITAALIFLPSLAALAAPEQPRGEGLGVQQINIEEPQYRRLLPYGVSCVIVMIVLAKWTGVSYFDWIAGAIVVFPALVRLVIAMLPEDQARALKQTVACTWHEFKDTFLRWRAVPYTLVLLFPMCSGAAIGLLPGIAQDYGLTGQQMAWMNGIGGALLTAAGALAATLIPARVRASVAYLSVGILNEATIAILWLGPLSPSTYFIGATLYLFTIGACYALFTAVVLEFLGRSGKSGCARYSIINSLGNVPVAYMTAVDGHGGKLWGARGLAGTDAVVGAIGATILLTYFLTRKHTKTPVVAQPALN
jgi:PAT family beta-lactamase induction signal transducer AmpG